MLETFLNVLGQMMIVLILLLVGYIFNRKKLTPTATETVLPKLVTQLFLPALTLNTFLTRCTVENLQLYDPFVLYGGIVAVAMVALSYPISRLMSPKDSYQAGVVRYCVSFPNTGAVAVPLVIAMFGTLGNFQLSLFLLVNSILTYSWGIAQLVPPEGQRKTFWQKIRGLLNPVFICMIIGGVLGVTGVAAKLPTFLYDGLDRVGTCYTVSALFLTGYIIADYKPKEIFGDKRVYIMTALRLIILPAIVLAVMKLLHVSDLLMKIACLYVVCPCGMNTVVYPAAYRRDSRFGASLVLTSSALSVITVPLIYALMTA